jgi:serine/threonine protein kinase
VSAPESGEGTTDDLRRLSDGELETVTIANRYEVRRELGRGGMAKVYEAHDRVLARPVALKVLEDVHAGDPRLLARFLSETRLRHWS